MKTTQLHIAAGVLAALAVQTAANAQTYFYPITTDTYIDNRSSTANFGASGSDKVVISSTPCRTLFELPSSLWSYSPSQIASATVSFYTGMDNSGAYGISLYALTHSFLQGTGAATADGATWNTYDGVNAWGTSGGGGDFDASLSVTSTKTTVSGGGVYVTWDITSLLANPTVASELQAYGALLTINGTPPATSPYQAWDSFNSSRKTGVTDATQFPQIEVTLVPEPSAAAIALLGMGVLGWRFRRQSTRLAR